jgi:hypothetical protein
MPNEGMVYFNLRIKKIGLVIGTHIHCYSILHPQDSLIHIPFHAYLSSPALATLQGMSPSLLSSQRRLSLFTHYMGHDA